jgi:hypothetical protein
MMRPVVASVVESAISSASERPDGSIVAVTISPLQGW